jgi:hypothetical protein
MPVVGTRVLINATFTNTAGALFDPAALSFALSHVSAVTGIVTLQTYVYPTDAQIVRTATGKYYFALLLTEAGSWLYRWSSTALNEELVVEGTVMATAKAF